MSISDTQAAKRYASIAEVAAAQAKVYALELETAPDYASQAKEAADQAFSASSAASQYAQNASGAASSAATSASAASASASQASEAAESAIGQTVRAPQGESLSELPAASSRTNRFIATGAAGDVELVDRESIPVLDSNGKIPVSMIPSIALTEPFVVNSQSAMLALSAQPGDIAKRTDLGYSFCLATAPASTLSNWVQLTDDVLAQLGLASGAGMIGATSLTGGNSTVQAELNKKPNSADLSAQTGAESIGATTPSGAATTVAAALLARVTSSALLSANGDGVGYQYSSDASMRNMQVRASEKLSILDFAQASDAGDYSLALNRIFTKYANATSFQVSFPTGRFPLKTPAIYNGNALVALIGQQGTTLSLEYDSTAANLSITSVRRTVIQDMEIEATQTTAAATKKAIYINCTGQDVSHTLANVRCSTTISKASTGIIFFDLVNVSLSDFSSCYVRYFGAFSKAEFSNNIAFRVSATTKISTDSRFDNCSVVGCEYPYLIIPPAVASPPASSSGYLEGIAWSNCTVVDCLYGPAIRGDNSQTYKSPMYRWIGGHIFAYKTCIDAYWVSQIIIDNPILYMVYDSAISGSQGRSAITLNETVTSMIDNVIVRLVNQPNDGNSQAVYVGTNCSYTKISSLAVYTASQGKGVVSAPSSKYTRVFDISVLYSGNAPSAAVALGGTNDVNLGGTSVYPA